MTTRRQFLTLLGATGLAAATPSSLFAAPAPEPFTFLFVTDAHIQPELNAAIGTDMAFKKARTIKADFAINGGDHVFDALGVPKQRALQLFDLYGKTEQDLGLKVYHTVGNHDVLGIYTASGIPATDPLYGKKLFEDRFGKAYYSFDHKGHHFIVLDSIGITDDHAYEGRIDAAQLQWLATDLAALPAGTPIIVTVHIPLVSAYGSYLPEVPKPRLTIRLLWPTPARFSRSLKGRTSLECCKVTPTSTRRSGGRVSPTSRAEQSAVTGGRVHISERLKALPSSPWPTIN